MQCSNFAGGGVVWLVHVGPLLFIFVCIFVCTLSRCVVRYLFCVRWGGGRNERNLPALSERIGFDEKAVRKAIYDFTHNDQILVRYTIQCPYTIPPTPVSTVL